MNVIKAQPNTKQSYNGNITISQGGAANSIYPIGSLYLTLDKSDVCPLEKLGIGVWELIPNNLCLQSAPSVDKAGEKVEAGLPNITGTFTGYELFRYNSGIGTGALYNAGVGTQSGPADHSSKSGIFGFDASKSNPIYGKSETVQPPALYVNIWKRIG